MILNSKTVRPGWLVTEIVPPWRSTIAFTIDRPSPLPPELSWRARRLGLVEPIEDVRQVLGRDARALVGHGDRHAGLLEAECLRDAIGARAELDRRAGRRVAQRVGGEVLQRLLEAIAIAAHRLGAGLDDRR